mmetsp:Transcript_37049/g.82374  ORF Transcript_37049/g.82374 Transcript_37049/m.82374 type:complete len:136 (+) Transcript_37049:161-568(+)|eukprot:CAMPEP_0202896352 /NCGR_PEP_ID=MMETSP1392-20130828/5368_1 /ASSEMBLY_ACC=CAM_ASM_000868 /TAXON_ID=225041 /ORGANISM="Chlamydomonas chlamydogama, Strain SAG 11-48b" /LENGTH=135 /DNA_ID=CAMNT_0049581681 /DNA_START=145 /DNA_END=552 /DNA_ORIENTATION=+
MTRNLRTLATAVRQTLQIGSENASAQQQLRTYSSRYSPNVFAKEKPIDRGSAYVGKNPYIEAWYWRRDHFEREFAWTTRNTIEVGYYLVGITAGFYALSVFTMRSADRRSGYPTRSILGSETKEGFVLPDEREFY